MHALTCRERIRALRHEGKCEMDERTGLANDRFEEVVAQANNCACAAFGLASLLAREHAPELAGSLNRELERYRRLVAELREIHRAGRPE